MKLVETFPISQEADSDVEVPVRMPEDMIAALRVAGFQRRSLGYAEVTIGNLVCEAVAEWLEREIEGTATIAAQL
jgi:hypothetical protein